VPDQPLQDPPAADVGNPRVRPPSGRSSLATLVFWISGAGALTYAVWAALRRSWVCDDAFISFRYAEHLVGGLGLVYNPGERVEGYSNFLWTLWSALGLWIGADAERWATTAGIACYAAAIGILIWNSWSIRREQAGPVSWIPVAAILAALHPDWNIFATGGLETSLFTLQITLAYVLLARGEPGQGRAAAVGLLLGLAAMTRPDGVLIAATMALFALITNPRRPRTLVILLAAFLVVWLPYTAWRISYFGDYFPNTYYAKSAAIPWYSQGAFYIKLYFLRYWPLLLGIALVAIAWLRTVGGGGAIDPAVRDRWRRSVLLAGMLALAYAAFVFRVGGDFMFGRFLIPVTPLLLVLFERSLIQIGGDHALGRWVLAGVAAIGIVFTPYPLPRNPLGSVRGIVFEPNYYSTEATEHAKGVGLALRPFFQGLPVRLAFFGGEARMVYYARPRLAIECSTGLTDRHIAHQPLAERTRIGHEKLADVDYVLGERGAHVSFFRGAPEVFQLHREIPLVDIEMAGVRGRVLNWDAALLDSLRRRGASIQDFPTELDGLLAAPSPEYEMLEWFTEDKLRRFYFRHVTDPERAALLRERIGAS